MFCSWKLALTVYCWKSPPQSGCDPRSNFYVAKTDLNSVFSALTGCLTKAKKNKLENKKKKKKKRLPYNLPKVRKRRDGFMSFPKTLTLSGTQTVSSRVWTRVADLISYNDNRFAKNRKRNRVIKNGSESQENVIYTGVAFQQGQDYTSLLLCRVGHVVRVKFMINFFSTITVILCVPLLLLYYLYSCSRANKW